MNTAFKPNPQSGILVGAPGWRDVVSPLQAGRVYLCRCLPGAGKSSLALGLVRDLVARPKDPVRVIYLSLELSLRDVQTKLATALTGVPFKAIDCGTTTPGQATQVLRARQMIAGWPLDLLDLCGATLDQIVAEIRQRHLATPGGIGVVVVDFIDAASPVSPELSSAEVRLAGLLALKEIAGEISVPIVVMAAVGDDEPDPADALLDLNIPEDGDEDDERGWREVSLLLLRSADGTTGGVRLMFDVLRMLHREWPVPERN